MKLRTEFKFVMPNGCADDQGNKQNTHGVMRLIKVKDLIDIHRDTRVKESPAYFYIVLLSKVIKKLGSHRLVNTRVIENLSSDNFAFLVDLLNEINHRILAGFPVKCSNCNNIYTGDLSLVGEQ